MWMVNTQCTLVLGVLPSRKTFGPQCMSGVAAGTGQVMALATVGYPRIVAGSDGCPWVRPG